MRLPSFTPRSLGREVLPISSLQEPEKQPLAKLEASGLFSSGCHQALGAYDVRHSALHGACIFGVAMTTTTFPLAVKEGKYWRGYDRDGQPLPWLRKTEARALQDATIDRPPSRTARGGWEKAPSSSTSNSFPQGQVQALLEMHKALLSDPQKAQRLATGPGVLAVVRKFQRMAGK